MIERLRIQNFKSLQHVDLRLGAFNLFVGTNASGKSNLLEALRTLQGLGSGYTVSEVFEGRPSGATREHWQGIRGGCRYACFDPKPEAVCAFDIDGSLEHRAGRFRYQIGIQPRGQKRLVIDRLEVAGESWPTVEQAAFEGKDFPDRLASLMEQRNADLDERGRYLTATTAAVSEQFDSRLSLLTSQLSQDKQDDYNDVVASLTDLQLLDLQRQHLVAYGRPDAVQRMGDHGENFASIVRHITGDPKLKQAYLAWLRELRPDEIEHVTTLQGALREPLFALTERGQGEPTPAPVLSDGTLRFAALVAAFFQPKMPRMLAVEEIETGLHPSRLQGLLDLFKGRAGAQATQVFATTHSPTLLAWLSEADWPYTFLCRRDPQTGASTITPLVELPHFREVVAKTQISELLTEGWLEGVL